MKALLGLAVMIIVIVIALSFLWSQSETLPVGPVGIVVPHHDMVASARAAYIKNVSTRISPSTIIILSPDHFGTNEASLVASTRVWETTAGQLIPDLSLIEKLQLSEDVANFSGEHGITTVLRDLATYFPDSKIVPIMVHSQISYAEVEEFITNLNSACSGCLLVASVDFSHTVQADIAYLHDIYTERELQQADAESLYTGAEVDSGASLSALALWAKRQGALRFETFSHTNSGYITNRAMGEMTTHIIGGYEFGEVVATHNDTVTLQFGGDVMFARSVAATHASQPEAALTGGLGERFFWGVDAAVVNLEGVFSQREDYADSWNEYPSRLRFAPVFGNALLQARISAVGLANNHRFDGGEDEYTETIEQLNALGITPLTNKHGNDPHVETIVQGDTKVALMTIATHSEVSDLAPVIQKYFDEGYFVIVYAHWGWEYTSTSSLEQEAMAKRWIDAGARLVVGSHPHVVQSVGVYKGVPIIYSLGNLLFDQTDPESTRVGAVLGVNVTSQGQNVTLVPISTYLKPEVIEYDVTNWTAAWYPYRVSTGSGTTYFFPYTY